jgi:hypothetical protein
VRFVDLLRTSVLLFAGAGTALAAVAIAGASAVDNRTLIYVAVGWWVVATAIGLWLGRRAGPTGGIERLMAEARNTHTLPELEPGSIVLTRLWPLGAVTILAGVLAVWIPQVPAAGAGYGLIWALAWRKQAAAVAAVEDRDGVRFYVEPGSALRPIKLVRTPWLRRIEPVPDSERQGVAT